MKSFFYTKLIIIFYIYAASATANDIDLSSLNPQVAVINNESYPRTNRILYRGLPGAQMSFEKAVRAMLGDKNANVESPMLYTIKQGLMNKSQDLLLEFSDLRDEYVNLKIQNQVDELKFSLGNSINEEQAFKSAIKIMASAYNKDYIESTVYNYSSPHLKTFPRAFLFSSVYIEVAKIYSNNILIFQEQIRKRSLDVNFWNKVKNGKWVHTNLSFPDRGEFVTPFYIPFDDIVGYQLERSMYNPYWNIWADLKNDLGYVAMKYIHEKENYVYIFDASGLQHIVQVNNIFCSAYSRFNPRTDLPFYTQENCQKKPKLLAIVKICTSKHHQSSTCTIPENLFSDYELVDNSRERIFQFLKNIIIDGNKAYYFTNKKQNFSKYLVENKNEKKDN